MDKLQDRVKAARKLKGLTQGDLAAKVDLSTAAISAIELGKLSPKPVIEKIATVLKIDSTWLLTGEGKEPDGVSQYAPKAIDENPWKDALVMQLKTENEKLWNLIQNLTGQNFPKPLRIAASASRVISMEAHLGGYLSKTA